MVKMSSRQKAAIFRRVGQGFEPGGGYTGRYSCDALGWPLGYTNSAGGGTGMRVPDGLIALRQAYRDAIGPTDDEVQMYPSDDYFGWFVGRDERALALYFAAAMAATGDL